MLQTPTTANKKKSPLGGSKKGRLASPAAAAQPLLPLPSSADKAAVLLREALVSKAKGDNRGYNYVLLQLQGVAGSKYAKIPPVWLHALKRCCTLLKPKHTELFKVLLSFDWSMGEEAVELYSDLVLNLISSNSSHIGPCLEMLVQNLQPRKGKGGAAEVEVSERIFKYIHQAIARVLELAPTSITPLFSALSANFPHRRLDVDTQRFYLSNLLQLTQYCPALRGSVLSIAVKKALELDVEIELALVAEDEEEEEEEFLFDLEINGEARRQEQSEMANKLDVLMGLLFRHLQSLTEGASYEERHELFSFMLQIFDSMIIKTHKSKYTQFLMFYLCWTEEPFAQNFLGYLLNKILDPSNHTLTRQTCAAYVGGFLARASFLSADVMQQTLNVLATWCQNYLDSCTRNIPDAELHALFYSVCQAIFYAVCFKHSAFLLTEDAKQHFASLQLEDIIESPLNPFKFCTISVVREFARVTSHYSALSAQCDCTALIERNQRLVLPTKTVFGGLNQMEAFFPFDPYLLRQSSVFVQDIYQTWSPPENTTPYNGENNNSETEDSQKGTGRLRSSSDVLLSTSAGMAIASYSPSPALLPSPLRLRSHASAIPIAASGSASPSASASEPASSFEEHGFTPEATLDIDFKLSWDGAL